MSPATGRVFIIGAGPGDPGLVTVRGARLLARADVVVYDGAAEAALRWARQDAERIAAGAAAERDTAQDAISMLIAEKARDGHQVARLKWGDPFVFDSGAKEALFLHEQGIPFEVVPGVPAAVGTAAYAGVPLTHPGSGDALMFVRGNEDESGRLADVDWEALSRVDGTIACSTNGRLLPAILQQLLGHGLPPESAATVISQGTQPGQQTIAGTVATLGERLPAEMAAAPVLLVVGAVVGLRDYLRWFDERPLFGRRIIVTRSQEQAGELIEALEDLGAEAIQAPTFRVTPADDPEALDRAAASVDQYQWVVFEAANAVGRFLSALARGPRDLRALGEIRVCAIGASTADRLLAAGIKPDVALAESTESVAAAMGAHGPLDNQRVLIVRPDHLRDVLAADLLRHGARVTDLVAYRTAPAPADSPAAQDLYRRLLEGHIDAVTFTSPTAVQRFAALIGEEQAADLLNTTVVATMGPVTAAAARGLGVRAPLVAQTYTVEGLAQVLVERFHSPAPATS